MYVYRRRDAISLGCFESPLKLPNICLKRLLGFLPIIDKPFNRNKTYEQTLSWCKKKPHNNMRWHKIAHWVIWSSKQCLTSTNELKQHKHHRLRLIKSGRSPVSLTAAFKEDKKKKKKQRSWVIKCALKICSAACQLVLFSHVLVIYSHTSNVFVWKRTPNLKP